MDLTLGPLIQGQLGGAVGAEALEEGLRLRLGLRLGEAGLLVLVPGEVGPQVLHLTGLGVHREGAGGGFICSGQQVAQGAQHLLLLGLGRLDQPVGGGGEGVVLQAVLGDCPELPVQGLLGHDPLQLLDALLFRLRQAVLRGSGGAVLAGAAAAHAHVAQLCFQLGQVHQRAGLGVHVVLVPAVGHIAQHRLGAPVLRQDVLQLQGQGALQALAGRLGGHGGGGAGHGPQVGPVGHIPVEIGHLAAPAVHGDGAVQGGGQAVIEDGAGEAVLVPAQAVGAGGLLQLDGLQLWVQHFVQKGLGGLPGLGGVAAGVGGQAGGARLLLGQVVPGDGPVLQGVDGQGAGASLPVQGPLAHQSLVIALPVEGAVLRGVQVQGVLHRLGDLGQAGVLRALIRRRGGQDQGGRQRGGQNQGSCAFHQNPSVSLVCPGFPLLVSYHTFRRNKTAQVAQI